eukprot:gene10784-1960_t
MVCFAANTTVFVVPHSHDDVGWLLTIDEYFVIVKRIYDTVVEALSQSPTRRFISVEMAFFSKWWDGASDGQRAQAQQLVKAGQLQFIVGGWTMQDEACTSYDANIDQMTEGHLWIRSLFGEDAVPRIGWQIDPFGHSSVCHRHFGEMGFHSTVLDRIWYKLKDQLEANRSLSFVWNTSPNLPSEIFTHSLDHWMYTTAVSGMGWDSGSAPVTNETVKALADRFVDNIHTRRGWSLTENVLYPWGTDFQHFDAVKDFENMDKLLAYVNANSDYGVDVRYATLGEYFAAETKQDVQWPERDSQDFFPYEDYPHSWWSGYYSSRSAQKGYIRTRAALLRAVEQLHALHSSPSTEADASSIQSLRIANAVNTHHDAVSGTSEPWVVKMYLDMLSDASAQAQQVAATNLAQLSGLSQLGFEEPPYTPGEWTEALFYNSLGWNVTRIVSLTVPAQFGWDVVDSAGNAVPFDVLSSFPAYPISPCQ